jgi:hypothetical protein
MKILLFLFLLLPSRLRPYCLKFHESSHKNFKQTLRNPDLIPNKGIKKKAGVLKILLPNHASVVFKDIFLEKNNEKNKTYFLIGYLKSLNSYLVQINLYERSEFLLVTNKGQKVKIWGMPYLSSNGHTVACFSQGLEYALYPNGIQILTLKDNYLTETCQFTTEDYEPIGLKWTGLDELTIKVRFYDKNMLLNRISYLSAKVI